MKWITLNICRSNQDRAPILWLMLVLTLLSGCGDMAIKPTEDLPPPFDEEVLDSTLGSTKEEVLELLGPHQFQLEGPGKTHFIYQATVTATRLAIILVPVPYSGRARVCSMLEFGADQRLKRFETYVVSSHVSPYLTSCREVFFSQDELTAVREVRPIRYDLRKRALEGDAKAQHDYGFHLNGYSKAWKWYCLAAHQGYAKAQYSLGNFYRLGRGPVSPDPVRAYLWYSLAGDTNFALLFRDQLASAMDADELAEAERLVAEWQPNPAECEIEAVKVTYEAEMEKLAQEGSVKATMYEYAYQLNDLSKAWRWYCLAAHHGDARARYAVGNYYRWGRGSISPDSVRAYLWYTLAGDIENAVEFKSELVTEMNTDQIAEAQRLVAGWRPNPAECEAIAAQAETRQ